MGVYDIYGNSVVTNGTSEIKRVDTRTICHQGWHDGVEGNSKSAFIKAKENGFSIVEADVYITSDGVLVMSHDSVSNYTLEEWQTSEEHMTLVEFLDLMRALNLEVYLDGKSGIGAYSQTVYDEIKKRGILSNFTFTGTFASMYSIDENVRCADLIGNLGNDLSGYRKGNILYCNYANVTEEEAQNAIDNGFTLEFYTFSSASAVQSAPKQATRFCTDLVSADDALMSVY